MAQSHQWTTPHRCRRGQVNTTTRPSIRRLHKYQAIPTLATLFFATLLDSGRCVLGKEATEELGVRRKEASRPAISLSRVSTAFGDWSYPRDDDGAGVHDWPPVTPCFDFASAMRTTAARPADQHRSNKVNYSRSTTQA